MNVPLLRETLELTLSRDDTFPAAFYARLFAAHPQLRALFTRNDLVLDVDEVMTLG